MATKASKSVCHPLDPSQRLSRTHFHTNTAHCQSIREQRTDSASDTALLNSAPTPVVCALLERCLPNIFLNAVNLDLPDPAVYANPF